MSRDQLSGFMLGLSVGVLVGTLMPPNTARDTTRGPAGEADADFDESAKRVPTSPDGAPDRERHSVSQSQSEPRLHGLEETRRRDYPAKRFTSMAGSF